MGQEGALAQADCDMAMDGGRRAARVAEQGAAGGRGTVDVPFCGCCRS